MHPYACYMIISYAVVSLTQIDKDTAKNTIAFYYTLKNGKEIAYLFINKQKFCNMSITLMCKIKKKATEHKKVRSEVSIIFTLNSRNTVVFYGISVLLSRRASQRLTSSPVLLPLPSQLSPYFCFNFSL